MLLLLTALETCGLVIYIYIYIYILHYITLHAILPRTLQGNILMHANGIFFNEAALWCICFTCMAKALRAAETGPFSPSQAAISTRQYQSRYFTVLL